MKIKRLGSRSDTQAEVETFVLAQLTSEFNNVIVGGKIITGRSYIQLDGLALDKELGVAVLVEVFGHLGTVKAAQRHKVHADVFKLALARDLLREQGYKDVQAIFAFVCEDCAKALSGRTWAADAAERYGIVTKYIILTDELIARLRSAQVKQNLIEQVT